jgi:8-oxo-dGTP pyrophosphatase MutT (NUDIX family)
MNEATGRGGRQRIPRPSSFREGDPAPWVDLLPALRRLGLAEVRAACAALTPARDVVEVPAGVLRAAVLVALFEEDGEARMILTKRPESMRLHQGEIAFPGGKFDPEHDPDLRTTALREAHEEIGLAPARVDVVGSLDPHITASGRFAVWPFVGLLDARPTLVPHEPEVDAVFDIALSELLREGVFREEHWEVPADLVVETARHRAIHFYELAGETVWGATARILTRFLAHLTAFVAQRDAGGAAGVS